ncbi:putative pentatricopeptide repeat-containing protein At5g08310, mitochondrial [Beta vulgaris subsp. vulgaris]|uniref:putative pentatricopeptide repeat-containing protein At5g08310, mitochondrial n=1 Tax=Beta vulgaris subsp. vulgaris TaxID=3555 RepID=UPI00053F7243|nr:putative pentatricopeptide repeat-containing protein At5g08310, mitochondrial [Beta vulgaris subsp. vulgaris]
MRRHYNPRISLMAAILPFTKSHPLRKPMNLINIYPSYYLFDFSNAHFVENASFISAFSTKTSSKPYKTDLSPDSIRVVDSLISIFTQQCFESKNQELSQLGCRITPEIVENVLRGIRNWKFAHNFFTWAKTQRGYFHNCYTYNVMASILSGVRRNAQLKDLVFDMIDSRCFITPGALGFLIRCLGSVGLVEEANMLFDQVREMGLCVPNSYSYNCLLETMSKSSLSDQAEKRLDEMRSFGWIVDKYTMTPLLQVYCNAREFEKALIVFNQMLERGWVDSHVLSILVVSFSKWGEVDRAFELIEKMEEFGLRLNEKTFYVLIHGFVSNSKVDKALQLFDKMCGSGFLADIGVYDVLIGGLCKLRKPHRALHLYSEMKNVGISPDIGILVKLLSSVEEEEIMAQLLEENGEGLEIESVKLLYNSVLNGLVRIGLIDRALELVKMMMEDDTHSGSRLEKFFKLKGIDCLDSSSFSIIINVLCQNSRLDEALQVLGAMDKLGFQKDTLLYNNLIDALSNADRVLESLHLLGEMKQLGIEPTHFTYNSIYGYFCRKGDVIGATSTMKEMCLYRHQPWIKNSTTLVKQLCRHGRAVEASTFLAKMVEEGLVPHLIPYSVAIDGFFKLRKVDCALELFHNIYSRGYRPDVVAYNILINGLCKASRMSEAENMLKEMLAQGLVPSTVTYNSLIDGWCKNGNIDQAMIYYSKMAGEDREPSVITYTTLIDGLCNTGRPKDALMLWNQMEVKACCPNRIAFMALISGLSKIGMPDMALYYLQEMEKKEMSADSFVYIGLMDSFLLHKNPVLALDILKKIIDKKMFPDPVDRNYAVVRNAIAKLYDDPLTSCEINTLLVESGIPTV